MDTFEDFDDGMYLDDFLKEKKILLRNLCDLIFEDDSTINTSCLDGLKLDTVIVVIPYNDE